jgi:hypothetical protein
MKFFLKLAFICASFFFCGATESYPLDGYTRADLFLEKSAKTSLVDVFEPCRTNVGTRAFYAHIANPSTDIALLKNRQQAIQQLASVEPKIQRQITGLLTETGELEARINAVLFDDAQLAILREMSESFMFSLPVLRRLNAYPWALSANHYVQTFSPVLIVLLEFFILKIAHNHLARKGAGESCGGHGHGHGHSHGGCMHHLDYSAFSGWIAKLLLVGKDLHTLLHVVALKDVYTVIFAKIRLLRRVQALVADVHLLAQKSQQLCLLIEKYDLTEVGLVNDLRSEMLKSEQLLHDGASAEVSGHVGILSFVGPIIVGFNRLVAQQNIVQELLESIGAVDMYFAVARTMQTHQSSSLSYCFAEFIDDSSPQIVMHNAWLPVLEKTTDVAEIVSLSFENGYKSEKGFLLFGANGIGKSTALRCVGVNVVLAQTFGIAAAAYFALTPVAEMCSLITVNDDLGLGLSSFFAQRARVERVEKQLEELNPSSFALVLCDDSIGHATSFSKGQKFAQDFFSSVLSYKNIFCFAATHIDSLVPLCRDGGLEVFDAQHSFWGRRLIFA